MAASLPPRTWAEIDLGALRHNLAAVRRCIRPGVQVVAVVKANAYGHGVEAVVKALRSEVEHFGVANLAEALEVRTCAPETPVFLLGPALPEERALIAEHGIIPSLSTLQEAEAFAAIGRERGQPVHAHLVVDTGMGRMGVWQEEVAPVARQMAALKGLCITGIASHLPVADEDSAFTQEQLRRFNELGQQLRAEYFPAAQLHIGNSAGVLGYAQPGDLVRPGLMLYGSAPLAEFQSQLRPVLTWKTRVSLVREVGVGRGISYGRTYITERPTRIATLAVGYADGFRRHLTLSGAEVLIRGRRCPLLGRVTMDQLMVDLDGLSEVTEGDEVVLLGRQGNEEILVAEMARKAGTIAWEIFTGLGKRIVRQALE